MISNFLLGMMILSYSIPISYIYRNYTNKNQSISSVIGSDECQRFILVGMIIMGTFTVLYELNRQLVFSGLISMISMISMICLLVGIYGVILVKEDRNIHYVFAVFVFISIIAFMGMHCWCNFCDNFLNFSLYVQILFLGVLACSMVKDMNIFFCESFLIINFAIYYLYLHIIYNK